MAAEVGADVAKLQLDDAAQFAERKTGHEQYFKRRVELFNEFKNRHDARVAAAKEANVPITVVLPDGAGENEKRVRSPVHVAPSSTCSSAFSCLPGRCTEMHDGQGERLKALGTVCSQQPTSGVAAGAEPK